MLPFWTFILSKDSHLFLVDYCTHNDWQLYCQNSGTLKKKRERIGVARLCVSHENSQGVANSDLETEGKMGLRIAASWLGGLLKMTQSCKVDEEARLDKQTNKQSYLHGVL